MNHSLRPAIRSTVLLATLVAWGLSFAAPRIPQRDDEPVARLPATVFAARPRISPSAAPQTSRLAGLDRAIRDAGALVELGRRTGDPRYAGQAQAILRPWWDDAQAPDAVLLLRAVLKQRNHQFDDALADLDKLLARRPGTGQARLSRAVILQVQSRYPEAAQECERMQGTLPMPYALSCALAVSGATGKLQASLRTLERFVAATPVADPAARAWMLGLAAELAERAGRGKRARQHYLAALRIDPQDQYLLAAYADFLLDAGRNGEVLPLLQEHVDSDPLLLRLSIATQRLGTAQAQTYRTMLRERFQASRRRADRVHLREEARFALSVERDAAAALRLATENWAVQKEPADARLLLESGLAAGDDNAIGTVRAWLAATGMEDRRLQRHLASTPHPSHRFPRKPAERLSKL